MMQNEILSITDRIKETFEGSPWYGRSVFSILADATADKTAQAASGNGHSMPELIWHIITWAEFTLRRIERKKDDPREMEILDWRQLDPETHSWEQGVRKLREVYKSILAALQDKNDDFLDETVEYRDYNFRFLINGMVDHTIYHLGQIALVQKS